MKMNMLKSLILLLVFVLVSITVSAQMIGAGIQAAKSEKVEFAANVHTRYYTYKGDVNFFLFGGLDYTGGSTKLSGLNTKAISPTLDFASMVFGDYADRSVLWLSCDAGYLRNFNEKRASGIVLTPNIMCAYSLFYIKTGYDMNVSRGNNQFFVRLGLILSL